MKSKDYYRTQYELRKQQFEASKKYKVDNLRKDQEAVNKKISELQDHLKIIQKNQKKVSEEEFISFEDFFRKISEQSEKAKKGNQKS